MQKYNKYWTNPRRRQSRSHAAWQSMGGIAQIELLETRKLLSAVTWSGAGDGKNWSDPHNWSTGAIPNAASDVTVNAPAGRQFTVPPPPRQS